MATPIPSGKRAVQLWVYAAIGLGALLVCILSAIWYVHHQRHMWTNDAYLDGYQITISSDINARLISLFVDEGDFVQEGQLLCQLDESIYNSQKLDAQTTVALLEEE